MTLLDTHMHIAERNTWVSTLMALPSDTLLSTSQALTAGWKIQPRALPQTGLGMLKLQDSAFEEAFYLGEFPLSSVWLQVQTPEGVIAEGAAQVMDDRIEVAEALALCDAILSAQLPGWQRLAELLVEGEALLASRRQQRKLMLATTRVDFSLLDEAGENDQEASHAES